MWGSVSWPQGQLVLKYFMLRNGGRGRRANVLRATDAPAGSCLFGWLRWHDRYSEISVHRRHIARED